MSSSNCCFLTCTQISQKSGQEVWYSHLFQNFPQFTVIHTVKGFGIVNKAEIYVFLDCLAFPMIQRMLAIWSLVPLPFRKPARTPGSSQFTYCWSLAWTILSITLLACEMSAIVHSLSYLWHCHSLGLEWKWTFSSLVATAEFSKFAGILSAVENIEIWIVFFVTQFTWNTIKKFHKCFM